MSYYTNQDLDFVIRTKKIIEQYLKYNLENEEKFEITLFINCCVGLLVVPQQRLFDRLPTTLTNQNEWGISPDDIKVILKKKELSEEKSICNIARHLRNSIAHYRFKAYPDENNVIKGIHFEDKLIDNSTVSFNLKVSIIDLKKFVERISDLFIEEMEKSLGIIPTTSNV